MDSLHAGDPARVGLAAGTGVALAGASPSWSTAVSDSSSASIVWVLIAERDVPGAVTDADVDAIVATLRPAGLEHECEPSIRAVGSWC